VTYPIRPGTVLSGADQIVLGSFFCMSRHASNAAGKIIAPSSISAGATTNITVCGIVSAYQAATLAGLGSITIGGTTYPIAAGTALSGADQIVLGSHFCLTARVSASGQIVPPSSIAAGATTTINVCGTVTAYSGRNRECQWSDHD
jgi:hypothetical protein